jgi:hypothetical protein
LASTACTCAFNPARSATSFARCRTCSRSSRTLVANRARLTERRGRNVATVATARKLLTLVYYGLRDGHIRSLEQAKTAA